MWVVEGRWKSLLNVIDHLQKIKNEWEEKYNDLGQDFDQLKAKEQECEELKHKVELMMDCASCKIDEYKQALDEIEEYLDTQQKYFDGEDYHNLLDIINKVKEEINEES